MTLHHAFKTNNSREKIMATTYSVPKTVEAKEVHQVEIEETIITTSIGAHS